MTIFKTQTSCKPLNTRILRQSTPGGRGTNERKTNPCIKPPDTAPAPSPSGSDPAAQPPQPPPSPPGRTAHPHRTHTPTDSPAPAWTRSSSDPPQPPPAAPAPPPASPA